MDKENKYKLNIQFFSEDPTPPESGEEPGEETPPVAKSFDDILKENKEFQSEYDKRQAKALATREANLKAQWESEKAEQERLNKLSEADKLKELEAKRSKELKEKELELAKKELNIHVTELCLSKGLEKTFVQFVQGATLEESEANIDALNEIINARVETQRTQDLTRLGPPKTGGSAEDPKMDKLFSKLGI